MERRCLELMASLFYVENAAMPVQDWSRIFDRAFHDFHLAWIAELRNALNSGVLPPPFMHSPNKSPIRPYPMS